MPARSPLLEGRTPVVGKRMAIDTGGTFTDIPTVAPDTVEKKEQKDLRLA